MKKPSVIAREKMKAARQWVFRWRGLDGTPLRGLLAIAITSAFFALFAATIRVRVSAPQQWVEKKASVIHLPVTGEGALWALRAREGGPFPSRIDPAEWEQANGLGGLLGAATRLTSPAYAPALRDLPPTDPSPSLSAAGGQLVFPKHAAKTAPEAAPRPARLQPVIYPLSGITAGEMPTHLPPFEAPVDMTMASTPWRFLLRLGPEGAVIQCDALSGAAGARAISDWLGRVNFGPAQAARSEWIGIGLGFTNTSVE